MAPTVGFENGRFAEGGENVGLLLIAMCGTNLI